jgi:hypothetical protein
MAHPRHIHYPSLDLSVEKYTRTIMLSYHRTIIYIDLCSLPMM